MRAGVEFTHSLPNALNVVRGDGTIAAMTEGRRLRLFAVPIAPSPDAKHLVLGVGEVQTLATTVRVDNCVSSSVQIIADPANFEVLSANTTIDLGPGTFERTIEWRVKATAPGSGLGLEFLAVANGLRQSAMFPVTVHAMPELDN